MCVLFTNIALRKETPKGKANRKSNQLENVQVTLKDTAPSSLYSAHGGLPVHPRHPHLELPVERRLRLKASTLPTTNSHTNPRTFPRCSVSASLTASCCLCSSSLLFSKICSSFSRSETPRPTTACATSRFTSVNCSLFLCFFASAFTSSRWSACNRRIRSEVSRSNWS